MTPRGPAAPEEGVHVANSFDLLRIVAALMVLFSHEFALTGRREPAIDNWQSIGGVGLLIFFVMSGYLVTESWQRDPNVWRFGIRRLLRIWPGLAVVVLLTAFCLGPIATSVSLDAYFKDPQVLHYLGILRFNDAGHLPGVFENNPIPVVNGSLWTLPIEVRWYEYLAVAGVFGVVRWRWLLVVVALYMAIDYFFVFDVQRAMASGEERRWKQELGLYFLAGACLRRFAPELLHSWKRLLCIAALVGSALYVAGFHHAAYWVWLPPLTIVLARTHPGPLGRLTRHGDLSYGAYIYAFPIQQSVVALTRNAWPFALELAVATSLTLAIAWMSWHLVEAPALKLKPRSSRSDPGERDRGAVFAWIVRSFGVSRPTANARRA